MTEAEDIRDAGRPDRRDGFRQARRLSTAGCGGLAANALQAGAKKRGACLQQAPPSQSAEDERDLRIPLFVLN